MTKAIVFDQNEFQKLQKSVDELITIAEELRNHRTPPKESPMTKKETARFLKCSTDTVDKRFGHLRHVVPNGPIYWYASEIENYIKKQ